MSLKDKQMEFSFSHRDLWEWAMGVVKDPLLAPHFHWDAVRLSKYDGAEYVPFIHEPWTAGKFWRVQVSKASLALMLALS